MNKKIKEALQTLRDAGYYVENLWSIEDVDNDELTKEEKLEVLQRAIDRNHVYYVIKETIYDELLTYTGSKK